jgi:hypothetical protein
MIPLKNVAVILVVGQKLLGGKVNIKLFLIIIGKAEIEIHFKRQMFLSRFPEQKIKSVLIFSRKIAFPVDICNVLKDKRNPSVFLAVKKMQNNLGL